MSGTASDRDTEYFRYYGGFEAQQNMLLDTVRTDAYRQAFMGNRADFEGKVVVDVGAGSGVLSCFAAHCGAKKVYAIEAGEAAHIARALAAHNGLSAVQVWHEKVENCTIDEPVDMIISEPMGVALFHERMWESVLWARDQWLSPEGNIFPGKATLSAALFSDGDVYASTRQQARFWESRDRYGLDWTALSEDAYAAHFSSAIVGPVAPDTLLSNRINKAFDFLTVTSSDIQNFDFVGDFIATYTGIVHGVALWFDVSFMGTAEQHTLSTAPFHPLTHWYQTRLLFPQPLAVNCGQTVQTNLSFVANNLRSYDIDGTLSLKGAGTTTELNEGQIQTSGRFSLLNRRHLLQPAKEYMHQEQRMLY